MPTPYVWQLSWEAWSCSRTGWHASGECSSDETDPVNPSLDTVRVGNSHERHGPARALAGVHLVSGLLTYIPQPGPLLRHRVYSNSYVGLVPTVYMHRI